MDFNRPQRGDKIVLYNEIQAVELQIIFHNTTVLYACFRRDVLLYGTFCLSVWPSDGLAARCLLVNCVRNDSENNFRNHFIWTQIVLEHIADAIENLYHCLSSMCVMTQ